MKLLPLLLLSLLSACATWSKHGVTATPPRKITIAVLPVRIAVRVKRLSSIETVAKGSSLSNQPEAIRQQLQAAADDITGDLEARLGSSYFFSVIADSEVRRALASEGVSSSAASATADQLRAIGRATGGQVLLVTDLSGYGAIKRRWLFYLIGSGAVEGVVQGAIVATATSRVGLAAPGGGSMAGIRPFTPSAEQHHGLPIATEKKTTIFTLTGVQQAGGVGASG